jgi:hypothetical protein
MNGKTSVLVGWVLTVLDTLVLGIPCTVLAVESGRGGRFHSPWTERVLISFGSAWLVLLVVWLAAGHLNARPARFAWYSLVLSLLAMVFVMGRPELQ